jgi:transposase
MPAPKGRSNLIYCGIDWAEKHHDVALIDDTGQLLAKRRITDDMAGYRLLLDLLAEYGDPKDDPIPIAIETSRGLLVAALRQGNRKVFAINPMAAARYRDRHGVSRKKSDPGDALVLANILRTDMPIHRPLPADTDLARAIAVLARAQQDATWNRQQIANQLRSLLREYYPRRPGRLRRMDQRAVPFRSTRTAQARPHPEPGRPAHPRPAPVRPQTRWAQPRHRSRGRPAPGGLPG